jgi:hypothetical protein
VSLNGVVGMFVPNFTFANRDALAAGRAVGTSNAVR